MSIPHLGLGLTAPNITSRTFFPLSQPGTPSSLFYDRREKRRVWGVSPKTTTRQCVCFCVTFFPGWQLWGQLTACVASLLRPYRPCRIRVGAPRSCPAQRDPSCRPGHGVGAGRRGQAGAAFCTQAAPRGRHALLGERSPLTW